jgi:hypothetical protein
VDVPGSYMRTCRARDSLTRAGGAEVAVLSGVVVGSGGVFVGVGNFLYPYLRVGE